MVTEGDLELLAEEQVLEEEALAAAQGVDDAARSNRRSSIIGAGSAIVATSRGGAQTFAPLHRLVATTEVVKGTLERLADDSAALMSPLMKLRGIETGSPSELRDLVVRVIEEISSSSSPREAEAGRLVARLLHQAGRELGGRGLASPSEPADLLPAPAPWVGAGSAAVGTPG